MYIYIFRMGEEFRIEYTLYEDLYEGRRGEEGEVYTRKKFLEYSTRRIPIRHQEFAYVRVRTT